MLSETLFVSLSDCPRKAKYFPFEPNVWALWCQRSVATSVSYIFQVYNYIVDISIFCLSAARELPDTRLESAKVLCLVSGGFLVSSGLQGKDTPPLETRSGQIFRQPSDLGVRPSYRSAVGLLHLFSWSSIPHHQFFYRREWCFIFYLYLNIFNVWWDRDCASLFGFINFKKLLRDFAFSCQLVFLS